jgi:hypothetical protein
MTPERLEEIKTANDARTPGKWTWWFNLKTHNITLQSQSGLGEYVLSFRRWGAYNAQPWFQNAGRGIIETFKTWAKTYADYACQGTEIEHPDAKFIAAAPEYVTELLALVDEQQAELEKLRHFASLVTEVEIEGVPV